MGRDGEGRQGEAAEFEDPTKKQEGTSKTEPKASLQSNVALVGQKTKSVWSGIPSLKFNRQRKVQETLY